VLRVEGIKLIRLSSMHIKELPGELLDLIVSERKIAPHFHLSLQSGSNRILKLMERGYGKEDFREVVDFILDKRPESAIGTDLIVGFPGESEEDFEGTLEFIRATPFAYLHIFPYSDRPFTKASTFKGKVPERIKKERVRLLKELDEIKREEFYRKNVGKRLRATVFGNGKLLTENYITLEREVGSPAGKVVEVSL